MKRPVKKPSEVPVPVSAPANWHRKLAAVVGQLSMAVVRRSMTKGQVENWSTTLAEVLEEMKNALATRPR